MKNELSPKLRRDGTRIECPMLLKAGLASSVLSPAAAHALRAPGTVNAGALRRFIRYTSAPRVRSNPLSATARTYRLPPSLMSDLRILFMCSRNKILEGIESLEMPTLTLVLEGSKWRTRTWIRGGRGGRGGRGSTRREKILHDACGRGRLCWSRCGA